MAKPKLTALQSMILGIMLGMLIVFGAFLIVKNKINPKPIEVTQASGSKNPISQEARELCPVCRKQVSSASNFYENIYGKRYNFCNEICYRSFKDEPVSYIKNMDIDIEVQLIDPQASGEQQEQSETANNTDNTNEDNIPNNSSQDNVTTTEEIPLGNTDDIPMPEEIPLDSSPSEIQTKEKPVKNSSGFEEIPLNSKQDRALTPTNQKDPAPDSNFEEIPLGSPNTKAAPPSKPKPQAKPAPSGQKAEEIKRNTDSKSTKQQELQIEEIPLN